MLRALIAVLVGCMGCGRISFDELAADGGPPHADTGPSDAALGMDAHLADGGVMLDALPADDGVPDGAAVPDAGGGDAGSEPDASEACAVSCTVDLAGGSTDCAGRISGMVAGDTFTAVIDMSGMAELVETVTACDPTGWIAHLSDSPTGNGGGGDGGSTSNDAEVDVSSAVYLRLFPSQDDPAGSGTPLAEDPAYLAATGCTTFTWTVRDQYFASDRGAIERTSPYLFRIDPPADSEGTPDALWYVGLDRTYSTVTRRGTGVTGATFCIR